MSAAVSPCSGFSFVLCSLFPSHTNTTPFTKAQPGPLASVHTNTKRFTVHPFTTLANLQFALGWRGNDTTPLTGRVAGNTTCPRCCWLTCWLGCTAAIRSRRVTLGHAPNGVSWNAAESTALLPCCPWQWDRHGYPTCWAMHSESCQHRAGSAASRGRLRCHFLPGSRKKSTDSWQKWVLFSHQTPSCEVWVLLH